jgi:hypothetical protein
MFASREAIIIYSLLVSNGEPGRVEGLGELGR